MSIREFVEDVSLTRKDANNVAGDQALLGRAIE